MTSKHQDDESTDRKVFEVIAALHSHAHRIGNK